MNRIYDKLAPHSRNSDVFKEVARVEENEFKRVYRNLDELSLQFSIETATWGLAIYEKEFDLPIKPDKSFDERRNTIKAKVRGIGKVDSTMIQSIVQAFTQSEVDVTFNGKINIFFSNKSSFLNIGDIVYSIEEVKPAHLDYTTTLNFKQDKSDIYVAASNISGEDITVYPYSPKEIEMKTELFIGLSSNSDVENVTVLPERSD